MLETLAALHGTFATLWVVWFFVLFTGILVYVMSPRRKRDYERQGDIPLRDESPSSSRR